MADITFRAEVSLLGSTGRETVGPPFTAFNFEIEISVDGVSDKVCSAAFSECDGLDMTMEPKTLQEGGNNTRQFHLAGPVKYGTLTLKRGMTDNFDLWKWFETVNRDTRGRRLRGRADVIVYSSDHSTVQMQFTLTGCLPTKLKAPALNAKDGAIAIEEMQIAYETLTLNGAEAAAGLSLGFSASASAGISASASAGFSAGF